MSRWRLNIRDEHGRAIISLLDKGNTIGVGNMSVQDYTTMNRTVMSTFIHMAKTSLFETLQRRLWAEAQRMCDEDTDAAKRRLIEFGWNAETINTLINEMVLKLAEDLLNTLPEHVT